jgi:hypothetical protein
MQVNAVLAQYRTTWVALCILLMVIDTGYLGFRTLLGHAREPFGDFLTQRVGILLLLVVIGLVDYLLPSIPLLYGACLFYSGVFIAHIIKQVREEGVTDLPPGLKERADEMQRSSSEQG